MRIMLVSEMLDMLRMEARISTNAAHGVHLTPTHTALLRRIQEELYDAYDWPFLHGIFDKAVLAGDRYLEYPAGVSANGIAAAFAKQTNGHFLPMDYGIGFGEYNDKDSSTGEDGFPIRRWQHYLSNEAEQVHDNMFEVWPIPDQDTVVRFSGKRALFPFTEAGHRSTIDGPLIVLHAAAEILAGQKAEDATLKLQKAQARMDLLKKRMRPASAANVNMSKPARHQTLRRGIDYMD